MLTLRFYCPAFGDCQQHSGTWAELGTGRMQRGLSSALFICFTGRQPQHSPSIWFWKLLIQYLGDSSAYSQPKEVFQTALCATYRTPAAYNWKPVWTPGHPGTLNTGHQSCSSSSSTLWCKKELSSSLS